MMLLFCAKHILHNNLPVSVYLRDLRVAVGRHVVPQPLTDYRLGLKPMGGCGIISAC